MKLISSSVNQVLEPGGMFNSELVRVQEFTCQFGLISGEINLKVYGRLAGELREVAFQAYLAAQERGDRSPDEARAEAIFATLATL